MILGFIVGMLWATPFWMVVGLFFKDDLDNNNREVCSYFVAWLLSIIIAFLPTMLGYNPYVSYHNLYRAGQIYNQTQLRGSIIVGACCALTYACIFTIIVQELLLSVYDLSLRLYNQIIKLLRKII